MKIRLVGVALCHADRRTDGGKDGQTCRKLIVAFRNSENGPKNVDRVSKRHAVKLRYETVELGVIKFFLCYFHIININKICKN